VTGTTAIRCVTGDVDKGTLLLTFRADIRRRLGSNKKAAPGAFPVCESAPGTNISSKPAVGSVTAVFTSRFSLYTFQDLHFTPCPLCTLINAHKGYLLYIFYDFGVTIIGAGEQATIFF
jgi:hypothetical protein